MSMDNNGGSKPWERPWTTNEIRQHSSNWNLAGDSGLLNHLQQFSQNFLARTHATEVAIDSVVEDMKTVSTEISNVTNTFLSLANTQFVENRVYDDDEKETPTEEKKEEEKVKSKEQVEAEVIARVKEALSVGMAVLDSHFDTVEVPGSDSEEDESSASAGRVVLQARNSYMVRPLPYLIGSREFMNDDRVGLAETSSDTEESPDQNMVQSSDSDSDMERDDVATLPKRQRLSSSSESENSEPESDRGGAQAKPKKHKQASVDALEDEGVEGDMFGRESPPEADEGVGPPKPGGAAHSFAAELAAKLGGVMAGEGESRTASSEPQPRMQKAAKTTDNLFSPPLESDGEDDALFGHDAGKFSGGRGLFDDLDDWKQPASSLWDDADKSTATTVAKSKPPETEHVKTASVVRVPTLGAPSIIDDLFASNPEKVDDEDDIFSSTNKRNPPPATASLPSDRRQVATSTPTGTTSNQGLFQDRDGSGLFSSKADPNLNATKKSSLFDSADLDDKDLFAVPTASRGEQSDKTPISEDGVKKKKPAGGVSIFGTVDLFGDKFSPVGRQHLSSPEVGANGSNETGPSSRIIGGMGENSSGIESGEFASISQDVASATTKSSSRDQGFQPPFSSTRKSTGNFSKEATSDFLDEQSSDSLFDKPRTAVAGQGSTARRPSNPSAASNLGVLSKPKKPVSLFDESDSGDDELLFSSTSSTSSRSRRSQGSGDLLATVTERKPLQKKGLFDDDDLLFGSSQPDEPGFDIFGGSSNLNPSTKNTAPKSVPEEKSSGDLFGSSLPSTLKQNVSGLFAGGSVTDSVDDIFAVPVKSKRTVQDNLNNVSKEPSAKSNLKSDLFSGSEIDGSIDIFPTNKPTLSNELNTASVKSSKVSSDLFSGNDFEDSVDIFGKSDNVSSNLISGNVFVESADDIFSSSKQTDNILPSKTDSVNDSRDSTNKKSSVLSVVDIEAKGKLDERNVDIVKSSNKPVISQKPTAPTKQSLFSESSEESDLFSTSTNVPKMETYNEITDSETSHAPQNKIESRLSQNVSQEDTLDKDNPRLDKSNSAEAKPDTSRPPVAAPRISHMNTTETEGGGNVPPEPRPRNSTSNDGPKDIAASISIPPKVSGSKPPIASKPSQTAAQEGSKPLIPSKPDSANSTAHLGVKPLVSSKPESLNGTVDKETKPPVASKPEPPKTLNIRKTTDILFGSSSNEDEDVFGSSWTGKASDDKPSENDGAERSAINRSMLSSNTLSALLEDYAPVPEKRSLGKSDVPDGGTFSTERRSTSEREIPHKVEASLEASMPTKAKSLEPSPSGRSPQRLRIDPMALLPGARPPSRTVRAEGGVSFEKPVETIATLHSAAKERARIQVKRRPSSRRARQEALRASTIESDEVDTSVPSPTKEVVSNVSSEENSSIGNDPNTADNDNSVKGESTLPPVKPKKPSLPSKPTSVAIGVNNLLNEDSDVSFIDDSKSPEVNTKEPPPSFLDSPTKILPSKPIFSEFLDGNSNPLSPSTDEEDVFGVPQELPSEYGSHKDPVADDSRNLFGDAPVLSPLDFNTRSILYGNDNPTSSVVTSGDLFSDADKNPDSDEKLSKGLLSSETLFPSGISKNKNIFGGSGDMKNDKSLVSEYKEVENPLDKEFTNNNKSESIDDDSEDIFGSSKSSTSKTEDLFPTVTKEAVSKFDNIFSVVKPNPKQDISSLFGSSKDTDLFSSQNVSQRKDSIKDSENLFGNKVNSSLGGREDSLFTSSENDPNNLFSSSNKPMSVKGSAINAMSDNLFPSDKPPDKPSDDSLFSSAPKEILTSRVVEDDLFPSDGSKARNSESDVRSDFFSGSKGQSSRSTLDGQSGGGLFSKASRTVSAVNTKGVNLFADDSPESDDLFASSALTTKKKEVSSVLKSSAMAKDSLFSDSADDIFGSSSTKLEPKSVRKSSLSAVRQPTVPAVDDLDELFTSSTSTKKSNSRSSSSQSGSVTTTDPKNSKDLFEDPLMAFKK